jgi:hypothetical protein
VTATTRIGGKVTHRQQAPAATPTARSRRVRGRFQRGTGLSRKNKILAAFPQRNNKTPGCIIAENYDVVDENAADDLC